MWERFEKPSPSISVFREASFGHGRLKVFNETHALWSWHRNDDSDSVTADQLWLQSLSSSKSCGKTTIGSPRDEL